MDGIVMDVQKFCLQDGPGIRTTVFLKGCNMRCKWCHNPESMEMGPVLMYREEKCTGCGKCMAWCPEKAHAFKGEEHIVDRSRCTGCGICARACPRGALEINGYRASAEQIFEEICKDEKYYFRSRGGVTFSGGEASMQFDFLMELLKKCRERNYHTALETNGLMAEEKLMALIPWVNLFLLDYKAEGETHMLFTGAPVEPVLNSLKVLQEAEAEVILRCPVIPGVNDTEQHFEAVRELRKKYPCIKNVEIMAYHDTGKGKWKECGKAYEFEDLKTVSARQKKLWEEAVAG